jgi:DNA adenine methylase
MIKPFLKWAGGKRVISEEITSRLPKEIDTYYEPMVGAGAVFMKLAIQGRFNRAVINDVNAELINVYRTIQTDVDKLVNVLFVLQQLYQTAKRKDDYFYKVRGLEMKYLSKVQQAARMIFLNRTCHSGLYRVNKSGGFNVPFGRYPYPKICDEETLRDVHKVLKNVTILNGDFSKAIIGIRRKDAVYFDPPYWPVAENSFTSYTANGFGSKQQKRLAKLARKMKDFGIPVVLSNSDVPPVRRLYAGFEIDQIMVPRRINVDAENRGKVPEVIIMSKKIT